MNKSALVAAAAIFLAGAWIGQSINGQHSDSRADHGIYPSGWNIPKASNYRVIAVPESIGIPGISISGQENQTMIQPIVWGFAGICSVLLFLGWRRRRSTQQKMIFPTLTKVTHADLSKAGIGGQYLERKANEVNDQTYINAPRFLLQNPYGGEHQGLTFEDRVQIAAVSSLRNDRTIGVIRFNLGVTGPNCEDRSLSVDAIAAGIQRKLRSTDCVHVLNDTEISVFISLLKNTGDLSKIAARLFAEVSEHAQAASLRLTYAPGTAIYPLDGYSSEALLESALYRIQPLSRGVTISPRQVISIGTQRHAPLPIPDNEQLRGRPQ